MAASRKYLAIIASALFLAGCQQPSAPESRRYEMTAETFVSEYYGHVFIRITYKNTSDKAQCFYYHDFSREFYGPRFRIWDETGELLVYMGPRPLISIWRAENTAGEGDIFVVIPQQESVTEDFDLTSNYRAEPGHEYSFAFWLPVIECRVFDLDGFDMPNVQLFVTMSNSEYWRDWEKRLKFHREGSPMWAEHGFVARLEDFQIESQKLPTE